jgi:stage IV sporulation protein FA
MEAKDPLKRRRTNRIRELQETGSDIYPEQRPPLRQEQGNPIYDPNWIRQMEDPEFVWRQRYKQEQALNGKGTLGGNGGWDPPPLLPKVWAKLLISVVLFAVVWGLFHVNQPWTDKGRQWVVASLTQNMDFQAVSVWYQEKFGDSPSFIPGFRDSNGNSAIKASTEKRTYFTPVHGKTKVPFDSSHSGLLLQTQADEPVYAVDTGQVIFTGPKEDTGFTVIIRHPSGVQSVYGRLSESRVEVNDWIKGGEPIGKVSKEEGSTGSLFFALTKEGRFVDPTGVIPFD